MKLKIHSIDFEEDIISFSVPPSVLYDTAWCGGDRCEVDLSEQLKRSEEKDKNNA